MRAVLLFLIITGVFGFTIKPLSKAEYDKTKAELGKKLFFDTRLSKHGDISCNSCHDIQNYGVDNRAVSIGSGGVPDTPMNTPSVYNVVHNVAWFWNGRADSLKQQAMDALLDKKEHNMNKREINEVLNQDKEYVAEFEKIYHRKPSFEDAADAIAEYEKSLVTLNSKFDRYLQGKANLTAQEKRGYLKFKRYGCITCHNGSNVGGNSFQKMGIFTEYYKIKRGLDRYYVTGSEDDKYVYKVPSLRNVEKTYPYFHDGSVKRLKEAVSLMGKLNLGIELSENDINDICAFLKTLSGEIKQ